jgi:hypothetical protein
LGSVRLCISHRRAGEGSVASIDRLQTLKVEQDGSPITYTRGVSHGKIKHILGL